MDKKIKIISQSPAETKKLAQKILAQNPKILILTGELGAGKTVFVKGLAKVLHIKEPVTSPSFVIIKEYQNQKKLVHIDLYRIDKPDLDLIGQITEYLHNPETILAIEWGEKILPFLPKEKTKIIKFKILNEKERQIEIY